MLFSIPGFSFLEPGLKLANAFGVFKLNQYHRALKVAIPYAVVIFTAAGNVQVPSQTSNV